MLDGIVTDMLEARAISFQRDLIDIYSASWGPADNGASMEGPGYLCKKALADGVEMVCPSHCYIMMQLHVAL